VKRLSSADFRRSYAREQTPVEVTAYGSLIGTWIPAGIEVPPLPTDDETTPDVEPAEPTFTIRPAQHARPVLRAKTVTLMDPLAVRKHEFARQEEVAPRVIRTRRVAD